MVRLLCLGDWGKEGLQLDMISRSINQTDDISTVVFLGDNFYEYGVKSVDDPLWNKIFVSKFREDRRYFAILGNHDYHTNPRAQIQYSSNGWYMPSSYYSHTFDGGRLLMLFLDTVHLAPRTSMMNGVNSLPPESEKQWVWIEQQLMAARSSSSVVKWLIAVGHYPVFSSGAHGDSGELVVRLRPLLEKYRVNLYLSGHEHNFQHLEESGVTYVIAGSGGKVGHPVRRNGRVLWYSQEAGYLELNVMNEKIEGVFHDQTNRPLYTFWLH